MENQEEAPPEDDPTADEPEETLTIKERLRVARFFQKEDDQVNRFEQRNIEIQKFSALQYSHLYHLKNLRKLDPDPADEDMQQMNLISKPPWDDYEYKDHKTYQDRSGFMRRIRVDSYFCNGTLYNIVRIYIRAKKKNSV